MLFGSVKVISNSPVFKKFIAACNQLEISFWDYFSELIKENKKVKVDDENLLSTTIHKKY